ncbi:HAMP domain-containing protein [Halobacteriales archaeon Cl-PHB]
MSGDDPDPGQKPNVIVRTLQTLTPTPIRKSFAVKFGLVLLVMAVSIGVIGFAATERITAETESNVEDEYRSVALQESDIIQQWLERNRLSTKLVSGGVEWDGTNYDDLQTQLEAERNGLSADIFELHLVDNTKNGMAVMTSTSIEDQAPVGEVDRGWLQDRADSVRQMNVPEVIRSDTYQAEGQYVVGFVSPVSGDQDRYLVLEVKVSPLVNSIQGVNTDGSGFTQVVNANTSQVLIDGRGAESQYLLQDYASSGEAREPIQQASTLRDNDDKSAGVIGKMEANQVLDETYTVGYAPIEGTNWVVVTHAPRSEVFGFVQTISSWGLIATLGAVLLIGIVGTVLGYSTSRSIDRLTAKTEQMREGNLDVNLYTSRIDNIGRLYDGFAEMRDALGQQIEEAERARKEAEVSRAEAMEMSNYLQEKAEEYSETMQLCAGGDLTQRMTQDGENESMDQIAAEFNEMIEELEKTTGQLKSYVDEVEEAGAEVEQSANTVRQASEQVADSIQTISDDAYDQKERLQNVSQTMDAVASQLEDYAANNPQVDFGDSLDRIKDIASQLDETADLSESTMAEAENVAGAAEEQAAELNEVGERAHDLQRYAQPLRDILSRFETEAEHEFVFSVGPTGGSATPSVDSDDTTGSDD